MHVSDEIIDLPGDWVDQAACGAGEGRKVHQLVFDIEQQLPDQEDFKHGAKDKRFKEARRSFLAEKRSLTQAAKKICNACVVKTECLDFAIIHQPYKGFGVFGEQNGLDIVKIRKEQGKDTPRRYRVRGISKKTRDKS